MSANLPINWADKKDSPLLADFIAKHGAEYCLTAEEINQMRNAVNEMAVIQQSVFLGSAEPNFTPTGTGRAYWIALKPGTYTNHGGVVLGANEIAFIIRDAAGAFTISKSALDLSTAIGPQGPQGQQGPAGPTGPAGTANMVAWSAIAFASGSQVSHLGKIWSNNAATAIGDIPGTSSKWVELLIGYNSDELYKRNESYNHKINNALNLKTGTNLVYSDSTIGNLGTAFTISKLISFNTLTTGTIVIIKKGDYLTTGWALFLSSAGLNFTANNINTIITKGITQNDIFLTIASDATSTKIYGWGKLIATITETTNVVDALTINPTSAFTNDLWLHYISIDSRALEVANINKEIDEVIGDYAVTDISRDFIGNTINLTTTGYAWKNKTFSGTAVLVAKSYPNVKLIENDILASFRKTDIGFSFLNAANVVTAGTVSSQLSCRVTDYFNVGDFKQLEIINAIENASYFNGFYDANLKIISLTKTTPTNVTTATIPSKIIDVPFGAVSARICIGNNGYVKGLNKVVLPKPQVSKDRNKEYIAIERVAPVVYDGFFDTISSQTPTTVKLFTVVSSTTTTMIISQADMDTFSIDGDLYPLAIKDSNGNYHFANVISDKPNLTLKFEKVIDYTPVKFMSVFDTTLALQGQHLSHYAGRALGENVIASINDFKNYKNYGSVGFIAHTANLATISATEYNIIDEKEQAFCSLSLSSGATAVNSITNDELTYKNGFSNDFALALKGSGTGIFTTMKTRVPFTTGFLEMIVLNPLGTMPSTSYVAVSTVNLVIENNGVEVYNAKIKSLSYEKIALNRTDWGDVTFKFVSNDGGNYLVYMKSLLFFRTNVLAKINPITSTSVVAVIADSWGCFPPFNDPTIEASDDKTGMIRASTGLEDIYSYGYMPKRIASKAGCVVDNWSVGGQTAEYGYSKMFQILAAKRYTHIVIGFFTNDNNLSTHRDWEGYIRLMVRMAISAGIQPIIIAPMGVASIGQRRAHGGMANIIRKGVYEV